MTKLFLIFHGRFPSEKAASLFAAKSAEAFALEGLQVTLVVPKRFGRIKDTAYEYYRVSRNFKIIYLPVIDLFYIPFGKRVTFYISFISFSISSLVFLFFTARKDDIIYSNEWVPIFLATFFFKRTFYELHDFPESSKGFFKWFFARVRYILAHNKWKMEKLAFEFHVSKYKIISIPNAVDIKQFDIDLSKEVARSQLGLPIDKKIAIYTGHLYRWKGVDTLAHAATLLPDQSIVVFVGGTDKDVAMFKAKYGSDPHILIAGHKRHDEMPVWQKAADVLVIPNTAKENISAFYTSPMKLFEYMASLRPIVASDIPSIREIVDDKCVLMVQPDNPRSLADGIRKIFDDSTLGDGLAQQAINNVQSYTWSARAKSILSFIS